MSTSTTVSKERCPKCAELGNDRHGDNLARYADGHGYCFSCGYIDRPQAPNTNYLRSRIIKQHEIPAITTSLEEELGELTYKLPQHAADWLSKYHLTEREIIRNQIQYSSQEDGLVFPLIDNNTNEIIGANVRYFGKNRPKYRTYLLRNLPKAYYGLAKQPPDRTELSAVVLVEDMVSAIKVARWVMAIPLLGTSISPTLLVDLVKRSRSNRIPILIWLDPDKQQHSFSLVQYLRQYTIAFPIFTGKDPKYYTTNEIHDFISNALELLAKKQG